MLKLAAHPQLARPRGPLLMCVLDGVGLGPGDDFDAVARARMPHLRALMVQPGRFMKLKAHGTAVGLPTDDDMGNSEVGHNALGSGRIVKQGASLVDDALRSGALFEGAGFRALESAWRAGGTFHVIGLLSDGGVHSRLDQILAILEGAAQRGAKKIRVHVLLDGRDVPDGSAHLYVEQLEAKLTALCGAGADARIASGGGRMFVTMDRYESDWSIVARGWRAQVLGDARRFTSAKAAINALRAEEPGRSDQSLPPFVVEDAGNPVGTIEDGDAVLFANFRGDRAIQVSRAFEDDSFDKFDRVRAPKVRYAGLMEYDGDLHIPKTYFVEPPVIEETSGEYLAAMGVRTFACSETQKFGHVTYFWNGNRSEKFNDALETYLEIASYPPPFDARPQMRAPEIGAAVAEALTSGLYDVVRANLANGDMVGHTGLLEPTILSCEAADTALGAMLAAVESVGGIAVVTADHGNADDMALRDKHGKPLVDKAGKVQARTAHTLAPVPFCLTGPGLDARVSLRTDLQTPGLANVAATVMELLGFAPPSGYQPSLLAVR
jgi:2,3-bisphosphoglycerate-independent phosphoglycerate mutase